jgi:hypothetical protein
MSFFNSAVYANLEQKLPFSPLKTLIGRHYSFEKLTQYSQGNNVLDAPSSNINGFLSRDTCVSSNQVNRPHLEQNEHFVTLKTQIGRQYSSQKLAQFSQGNNVLDVPASNIDGCLSRDTCISSTQLNRPIWKKRSVSKL